MAGSRDFPVAALSPLLLSVSPWLLNICICQSLALIMTMVKNQRKTEVTLCMGYITAHYLLAKEKNKITNKNYSS